jgi:hypothetical protein
MEQMEEVVVADGNRRPEARVGRRRHAGGRASDVADDDTPGAGEGSNSGGAAAAADNVSFVPPLLQCCFCLGVI